MSKRKPKVQAPHQPSQDTINTLWYTDEMIDAMTQLLPSRSGPYRYLRVNTAGNINHSFITPAVADTDIATNIDYYLDKDQQPEPAKKEDGTYAQDHRIDIFDQRDLFTQKNENTKIFIPYCSNNHWQLCEISITKNNLNFTVNITLHDPLGRGLLKQKQFEQLKASINRRLHSKYTNSPSLPNISFSNQPSKGRQRQARTDGNSCGVIMYEDLTGLLERTGLHTTVYSQEEIYQKRMTHLGILNQDHHQRLKAKFSGKAIQDFTNAIFTLQEIEKETDLTKRQNKQHRLHDLLTKLPKMRDSHSNNILVFYSSTKEPKLNITENNNKISIALLDKRGEYIVEVQRIGKSGLLLPNCLDVLHYRDGRLLNHTALGNLGELSESRSRVNDIISQAKHSANHLTTSTGKSWLERLTTSAPSKGRVATQ